MATAREEILKKNFSHVDSAFQNALLWNISWKKNEAVLTSMCYSCEAIVSVRFIPQTQV